MRARERGCSRHSDRRRGWRQHCALQETQGVVCANRGCGDLALSTVLGEQLTTMMRASFQQATDQALSELHSKSVVLFMQAKDYLNDHANGILTRPATEGDGMPSTVLASLLVYMEATVESEVERVTQSQSRALVVQTGAQVVFRFKDKIEPP